MCSKPKKEKKVKTTFKKGDKVIFSILGDNDQGKPNNGHYQDFLTDTAPPKELLNVLKSVEGKEFKVKCLSAISGDGGEPKDEYYDISIKMDIVRITLKGVNTYHLTRVDDEKKESKSLSEMVPNVLELARTFDEKGLDEVLSLPSGVINDALIELEEHKEILTEAGYNIPHLKTGIEAIGKSDDLMYLDNLLDFLK